MSGTTALSSPRRRQVLGLLAAGPALALGACAGGGSGSRASSSSSSSSSSASPSAATSPSSSPAAPVVDGAFGVKASGGFGAKPTLSVPSGTAPAQLRRQVLVKGSGATVASGQTLVVNYLGQTWKPANGKVNVFDNSYDRNQPAGFAIGVGQVIPGWDAALVGLPLGSRVLLSIPPALAYGAQASENNPLAGQTLVFVVDLIDALAPDVAASGTTVDKPLPAGLPQVTSEPGKAPTVTGVSGVKSTATPQSALLLSGSGKTLDPKAAVAVQIVQADASTGKVSQQTWGTGPQIVGVQQILTVLPVLKGQKVGSRAVTVFSSQGSGVVLVVDVVAQYA